MIAYVTDLEGRWDKLEQSCAGHRGVRLVDGALVLADGASLVFGGDAVDRGPGARRIVSALVAAKRRYGERVVLLAGNRDLNKLRLVRELQGHPRPSAPAHLLHDRPGLLRWIFSHSMGAREAFGHRAAELAAEGRSSTDEDVVDSFLADVSPGGAHHAFLASAQLAFRWHDALFVHGAVTAESLGTVPGRGPIDGVDAWVDALNAFYRAQMEAFTDGRLVDGVPAWASIIAYQAPLPGQSTNPASVIYGRLADEHNDPRLPQASVRDRLRRSGVRRLIVGHTPAGDVPAVLRADGFTLLMGDNAYGRVERGSRVAIDRESMAFEAEGQLDDGRTVAVSTTLSEAPSPTGSVTEEGRLVGAPVEDGWWTFRALPERRVEQQLRGFAGLHAPRELPEP